MNESLRYWTLVFLLYPILLIGVGDGLLTLLHDKPWVFFSMQAGSLFFRWLLIFIPFGIWQVFAMAISTQLRERPYHRSNVIAILSSLVIWGYYYMNGLFPGTGGANIGLGVLLIISPMIIFFVLFLSYIILLRFEE